MFLLEKAKDIRGKMGDQENFCNPLKSLMVIVIIVLVDLPFRVYLFNRRSQHLILQTDKDLQRKLWGLRVTLLEL